MNGSSMQYTLSSLMTSVKDLFLDYAVKPTEIEPKDELTAISFVRNKDCWG